MNKRTSWLLGTALIATSSLSGQSKRGPLEGVWQATEITLGGPQAITIKPASNLTIFAARHYTRVEVHTDKPRPVLANAATATAEQLREVWGPIVAETTPSWSPDGNTLESASGRAAPSVQLGKSGRTIRTAQNGDQFGTMLRIVNGMRGDAP